MERTAGCRQGSEEGHRRAEFQVVGAAHDCADGVVVVGQEGVGAGEQACSQDGMVEIGLGFRGRSDGVADGHGGVAEAGNLRKDEPHPVRFLPAVLDFREGAGVSGILGI